MTSSRTYERDEQVRRKVWEIFETKRDSGSEKIDALKFAEVSIPWHHTIIRRIAHHAGEHHHRQRSSKVKKIDTSAPIMIGIAAGTDGEESIRKMVRKSIRTRSAGSEQEPKVDGTEDRVPAGANRSTSNSGKAEKGANRVGKGQWSKTGGKKGGKGQEKGDIRVCWSCGKPGHIAANYAKESWNKSLKAVEEDKGDISEEST